MPPRLGSLKDFPREAIGSCHARAMPRSPAINLSLTMLWRPALDFAKEGARFVG